MSEIILKVPHTFLQFCISKTFFTQKSSKKNHIYDTMKKVGYAWLREKFNIQGFQLTHESCIDTANKLRIVMNEFIIS